MQTTPYWQDEKRLKTLLYWLYGILIIVDILLPFLSILVGFFIIFASRNSTPKLIDSHLQWLRKTFFIYLCFTAVALVIFIFSVSFFVTTTAMLIFIIGYLWAEGREILGLIYLWQNRTI